MWLPLVNAHAHFLHILALQLSFEMVCSASSYAPCDHRQLLAIQECKEGKGHFWRLPLRQTIFQEPTKIDINSLNTSFASYWRLFAICQAQKYCKLCVSLLWVKGSTRWPDLLKRLMIDKAALLQMSTWMLLYSTHIWHYSPCCMSQFKVVHAPLTMIHAYIHAYLQSISTIIPVYSTYSNKTHANYMIWRGLDLPRGGWTLHHGLCNHVTF